ncbi:MAG: retroviral-like aspartic protease family protein [Gammaproteobacteria bacterium]|nr:retroviral-like aspartic protease family protein [Gammaproteobacteria bacterium]
MSALRTFLILIIGLVAGLFLARYLPRDTPGLDKTVQSEPDTAIRENVRLARPTLKLLASDAGLRTTALATVVSQPTIIVAAIADFAGARQLSVETGHGQTVPVITVVTADEIHGIALLRTAKTLNNVEILETEAGAGSLQLGRRVVLQTPTENYDAQVNSAATQDELGAYHYAIKTTKATRGDAAAIIDPGAGKLLGLVKSGNSGDFYAGAVGNEPLNQLIARIGINRERTLDEYTHYYYGETTLGRLTVLEQFVASEQFANAIRFGESIRDLDVYTQKHSTPLLETAFVGAAQQSIDNKKWRRAIDLIDEAEQVVGLKENLRLLRAEAYQAVGDLESALDDLLALENPDAHRVRVMVIENAIAAGQSSGQSGLSLLQRAAAADPDYAPYHRLLGETLARQGDMAGALVALERAIALDPSIALELDPLLSRLRARRNTPPLTEVPIQRRRSTLYVNARVNGSTETFRFLFDTGASYTAITSETALRLGINNIFFGAPVVELETANGRVFTTTATLGSIDVSGARVDNVEAVILESMSGVDGLLGQSFLRHFDVSIDRTRGVIAFNRRLDE